MSSGIDKIMEKIKKCLALSTSANEHEAAAALRQAQKLMDQYGITELDIHAAQANEQRAKSGAKSKPAIWESTLAQHVAKSFGCRVILCVGFDIAKLESISEWVFVGCGPAPEIAQYAFTVLRRQARRARSEYIKTKLRRCKRATKTRRADKFSDGWVVSVIDKIKAFAGTGEQTKAIDSYMAKHYPRLLDLACKDRSEGKEMSMRDWSDFSSGHSSGKAAQLNRGVGSANAKPAIGRRAEEQ